MFPKNPMIFLMQEDTILNGFESSSEICKVCIKIFDITQTITPLTQAILFVIKSFLWLFEKTSNFSHLLLNKWIYTKFITPTTF